MVVKQLDKLGQSIFELKYKYPSDRGWGDRAKTVAKHIASAERDSEKEKWEKKFFDSIAAGDLVPGGRILFGAGRHGQNLLNCFSDDTLVLTSKGFREIKDIELGDQVLTHKGRFRRVVNKFSQGSREKLLSIKIQTFNSNFTLKVTQDHKIMTPYGYVQAKDLKVGDHINTATFNDEICPKEIFVSNYVDNRKYVLRGNVLGKVCKMAGIVNNSTKNTIPEWFGKTCNNKIDLNEKFALWIGYFLSEGCAPTHGNGIKFTFHKDEKSYQNEVLELGREIFGIEGVIKDSNYGKWSDVNFHSQILNEFHKNYLGAFFNKKILPWYMLNADTKIKSALLTGMIRGDGSTKEGRRSCSMKLTFSNPTLVFQSYLLGKSLGYDCSFNYNPHIKKESHSKTATAYFRSVRNDYSLYNEVTGEFLSNDSSRIDKITEIEYGREVWDISVDEDHSLVANGIVASNCYSLVCDDNVNSIATVIANMYKISCAGGGIGFSFSRIRPKGDDIQIIKNSAPGSVSVMKMINEIGEHVRAGASRRTALLAILNVDHPDLLDFLHVKLDKKELNNFNISVGITNKFLKACEDGEDWNFTFNNKKYFIYQLDRISQEGNDTINVIALDAEDAMGRANQHYKKHFNDQFDNVLRITLKAKDLWNKIWENSVETGCPGIFNVDLVNKFTNVSYFERMENPNPSLRWDTKVLTKNGVKNIKWIAENDPYCKLKNMDGEWTDAYTRKTGINKRLVKITFKNNQSVYATEEHDWPVYLPDLERWARVKSTKLKKADKIPYPFNAEAINNENCKFSREDGFMLGWNLGDGWISFHKQQKTLQYGFIFNKEDVDSGIADRVLVKCNLLSKRESSLRKDKGEAFSFVTSDSAVRGYYAELGAHNKSLGLPKTLWEGNSEFIKGFIDGLFSADGYVKTSDRFSNNFVSLKTSHKNLAEDLQKFLSFYGIRSHIVFEKTKGNFPNKKYNTEEKIYDSYLLKMSGTAAVKFAKTFTLSNARKQELLTKLVDSKPGSKTQYEKDYLEIKKIELTDIYEDVYDATVKSEDHTFQIESGITGNCGEVPLPNFGNCCLGHINLAQMVENGEVDWRKLANTVRTGIRFLDNVLTVNPFPIEECREVGHRSRRIGLGTTGLHYMLIKLGIRYGSEKCIEFLERLYTTIRNEAYLASMYIAEEKGSFPAFDADKFLNEEFANTLPARVRMLIRRNGIRNAILLTCAPVGTVSMVLGCSTGLEPIFSPMYMRRYREANVWRETVVVDPLFKEYVKAGKSVEELKLLFPGAYDVTPHEHMSVQATIQKFVDSSLSKTINLPAGAKASEFADEALAFASYLKGMTVYRAASKSNEPLTVLPLTEENIKLYITDELEAEVTPASCSVNGECSA